jgi:imidazolonepropionase-like amidohydrolase
MTVIEAGMVHPVAGQPIKNGVIVIRGERILAIGEQGDLQLPENTKVFKFPTGHVYPGLIDASTDAFTDAGLRGDNSLNGASKIAEGLIWTDSRDDQLIEHGITTAYINVRSNAQIRGQGAIVRPRKDGFDLWEDREQAAVQLRMSAAKSQPRNTREIMIRGRGLIPVSPAMAPPQSFTSYHALQRQSQLEAIDKLFAGIDAYRDAQEKFEKDLEKYESDFEKYLEYHTKKNAKKTDGNKPAEGEKKGAEKPPAAKPTPNTPRGSRRGSRRGEGRPPRRETPPGGGSPEWTAEAFEEALSTAMRLVGTPQTTSTEGTAATKQDPKPSSNAATPSPPAKSAKGQSKAGAKKDEGPKRPKYPKKPAKNPQIEALIKVVDGDLPLRIEAHRMDELRAALRLQRSQEIPLVILERAYAANRVIDEITQQGVTIVLTDLLPNSLGSPGDRRNPYAKFDPTSLPKTLNNSGVPFAIASGTARLGPLLPMMAASAVGKGLPEEAALRALTLTPAEILGIAEDTGSLTRGKLADVIVTDGPLLATDSRVLLVIAKGQTEYEAK